MSHANVKGCVGPQASPHGAGTDSRRAWAQALADRARSEGVSLTEEDGLLTSMVREVLQAGLDVEMADHLGYEPYESIGRRSGTAATGAIVSCTW